MEPLARRYRIALVLVVVLAFALRVAFILAHRHDILFDYPVGDEERYVRMARAMAAGLPTEPRAYLQPPGIAYALSVVFRIAGPGLLVPRVVQAAVSALAALAAFQLARHFFSVRVALGTAIVCALHAVLVFESYELLPPTWIVAADLVMLLLLLRALERPSELNALWSGIGLGVSAIFAPVVLPFALVAAVCLRKATLVLALLVGIALPIAPVTWRNWQQSHQLVLVSSNGGENFYLGNNAHVQQTLAIRPGRHWVAFETEPRRHGVNGPAAESWYFFRKGFSFYRKHPLRAAALFGRKLMLYFHGFEIPRDSDIYAVRSHSIVLRALMCRGPPYLPDGLLIPIALVGIVLLRRRWRELLLPYGFLLTQALVIAAFFVTSRYRAPALPVFAMFACAGVGSLYAAWSQKRWSGVLAPALACIVLAVGLNFPVRETRISYAAELDFYRGLALLRYRHDVPAAIDRFRAAAAQDPTDARFWFELGNAERAAGRLRAAARAWKHAMHDDPADSRAWRNAAVALERLGDLRGAAGAFEGAIRAGQHSESYYAPDHLNLALVRLDLGQPALALEQLRQAHRANPVFFQRNIMTFARAALESGQAGSAGLWLELGDATQADHKLAEACWQRGLSSNPSPSVEAQLHRRLE